MSILKGPTLRWWPESVSPGFTEMDHFCPVNRPTHHVLWGQISTPFCFCCNGYGLDPKRVWEPKRGQVWIQNHIPVPMVTSTFLAGHCHKPSPRRTQQTPNPFFMFAKVFLPWKIKNDMVFLGTKLAGNGGPDLKEASGNWTRVWSAPPANTVYVQWNTTKSWSMYGWPKYAYGLIDTDFVGHFQIRYRICCTSQYAVFLYARIGPTLFLR